MKSAWSGLLLGIGALLLRAGGGVAYPRLFGNVLSLSGSYWWAPKGEAPGWLTRQYQQSPLYPVRFWLQAGKFEQARPGVKR